MFVFLCRARMLTQLWFFHIMLKELAKTHRVTSWDHSASEGELICYPHYRLDKYKRKRLIVFSQNLLKIILVMKYS